MRDVSNISYCMSIFTIVPEQLSLLSDRICVVEDLLRKVCSWVHSLDKVLCMVMIIVRWNFLGGLI